MKSYIEVKRVYDLTELNSILHDIPADDVIRIDPEGSAYLVQYKVRECCKESCTCGGSCNCEHTSTTSTTDIASDPLYTDIAENLVAHVGAVEVSELPPSILYSLNEDSVNKLMQCCNKFGVDEAVALLEKLHDYNILTCEILSYILSNSLGLSLIRPEDSIYFAVPASDTSE